MKNQEKIDYLIELYKTGHADFDEQLSIISAQLTWDEFKQLVFRMSGELHFAIQAAKTEVLDAKLARRNALAA